LTSQAYNLHLDVILPQITDNRRSGIQCP
jgi:hypothetical protein